MGPLDMRQMIARRGALPLGKGKPVAGGAPARLTGIFAAVVTPMAAKTFAPNHDLLARHCRWLLANGCDGLAVLGTNSEANSFSLDERLEILERLVAAGIPPAAMMPGTGCCAIPDTVRLSRRAVELGASGVLMLPPFYYKDVSDEGLFASYSEVIERVGDARLRVYLYHFPAMSAVPLSLELIQRLVARYPETVVGMKDSTGDAAAMIRTARAIPGFHVFSGADQAVLPVLEGGGVGCITAGANVAATLGQEIFRHWKTDPATAAAAQTKLAAVRKVLGSYQPLPSVLKAILAKHSGNPEWGLVRPPLMPLSPGQADDLWAQFLATGFTPAPLDR